jgi:antitoxin (DNA-binding transcriptional repressor) of toxin-antitoxin stability system
MTTKRTVTDAAAPAATPKVKFEVTRTQLWRSRNRGGGGWPAVMRHIEGENAVVVVMDQGRVCAGIVADSGRAGRDGIALTNRVGTLRDAALAEGREVRITRFGQVVARIIPPERIPDYLAGWTPPAPAVATPKAVAPKSTTPKVAATKAVAPRATTPKATTPKATTPKAAMRRARAASASDARHAGRRDLIREAVERRFAGLAGKRTGGTGSPKARKRGRPSGETAFAKVDETLFAEKDEMTEESLAVLDEMLKG